MDEPVEYASALSRLRRDYRSVLAPTVRELRWCEHEARWTIYGTETNCTIELEDMGGFFSLSFDQGGVVEEVLADDPRMPDFLTTFDREPIELVYSQVGRFRSGWWVEFSGGLAFGETQTLTSRVIRLLPRYRETRFVLSDGAPLPPIFGAGR